MDVRWLGGKPDYMGVIREMDLPDNIDDFRVHYRVSRHLFDILLQMTYESLVSIGTGPHENIPPEKKLLVCLCYLANNQSGRIRNARCKYYHRSNCGCYYGP